MSLGSKTALPLIAAFITFALACTRDAPYRLKKGDGVEVGGLSKELGKAVVGRTAPDMQEFYRGAMLDHQGKAREGRELLERLLDEKRLGTVLYGTNAIVLGYAESGPQRLGHLVQIRLVDGEAPGLVVWIDDDELVSPPKRGE